MSQELVVRRSAEVATRRTEVVAVRFRPMAPLPTLVRRVMTPADWPWSVVILLHVALAGAVVSPLAFLAMYIGR